MQYEPWEALRRVVCRLAERKRSYLRAWWLDPEDATQIVLERVRRRVGSEGVEAWLDPARTRTLGAFVRHVVHELLREREGPLGEPLRSLEGDPEDRRRDPARVEDASRERQASEATIAARLAALTHAQRSVVERFLRGEEKQDIARTLGVSSQAVDHMLVRALERVNEVEEVRTPPDGDFPGPFRGRRKAWNRILYLVEREWTPLDLARAGGGSAQAMEKCVRRVYRSLGRRPP